MIRKLGRKWPSIIIAVAAATPVWVGLPSTGWAQIDEVIVSTRKREEVLQDIPISVQALTDEQIVRLNINDVKDISRFSTSLQFDEGFDPKDTRVIIRGLAPTRGRQNAALLIDGIDVTSESVNFAGGSILATTRLIDVERVEIVKGPQSALYGRSAFNGAIQYITRDPNLEQLDGRVNADIGSDNRYKVAGSVSAPIISDVLGFRLNGAYWSEDGFYQDYATLNDMGGDGWGIAGTLLWEPSESFWVKARAEYSDDDYDPSATVIVQSNFAESACSVNPEVSPSCPGNTIGAPSATSGGTRYGFMGTVPDQDALRPPTHSPDPLTGGQFSGTQREIFRASLIAEWDVGPGVISSWTGLTDANSDNRQDGEFDAQLGPFEGVFAGIGLKKFAGSPGARKDVSLRGQVRDSTADTTQVSQELRFGSDWDFPVQLTVGGLYWYEEVENTTRNLSQLCTLFSFQAAQCQPNGIGVLPWTFAADVHTAVTPQQRFWSRELTHFSVYSMLEWEVTDQWKLTGEVRYNDEEEEVTGPDCDGDATRALRAEFGLPVTGIDAVDCPFGPSSIISNVIQGVGKDRTEKRDTDWLTGRGIVEWSPNDNSLYYFSVARGEKPGGTSTVTAGPWFDSDFDGDVDEVIFDAEKLWSYEIGAKNSWLENTLQTNLAVFFQDYTDKQVGTRAITPSGQSTGRILNAGEAEVYGLEAEVFWSPTENWSFSAAYTFLDTEYTDFVVDTDSAGQVLRGGNCTIVTLRDPITDEATERLCRVDFSGGKLERAAENSFLGNAGYRAPMDLFDSQLNWFVETTVLYTDERWINEENTQKLDSYWLMDLRLGLAGDRWEVVVYADNLFDDDTIRSATDVPGDVDAEVNSGGTSFGPSDAVLANLPDPATYGVRAKFSF